MAKPNYSFQKRQRDLAKKIKKEEKKAKKAAAKGELPEGESQPLSEERINCNPAIGGNPDT